MQLLLTILLHITILIENVLSTQNVSQKWLIADKNFYIQMCGDATIPGHVSYNTTLLQRINYCNVYGEKKLSNGSSAHDLCKHIIFGESETIATQFWFDLKCNKTIRGLDRSHFYTECIHQLKRYDSHHQQQDDDVGIRLFPNRTNCLLSSKHLNMDQINTLRYSQFKYRKLIDFYGDALCSNSMKQHLTTTQKIDRFTNFTKCYQILNPHCFAKLEVALDIHQYQYYYNGFVSKLKQQSLYCNRREHIGPNLIIMTCDSEQYSNVMIKDYYRTNSQRLDALLSCKRAALIINQNQRVLIPNEKSMREEFNEMMQTEKKFLNRISNNPKV